MKNQKKQFKYYVEIIKRIVQCIFIFVWSYYVYVTIHNSTLIDMYGNVSLFPNGLSPNNIPIDLMREIPTQLETIALILIVVYLMITILDFYLQENIIKEIIDICFFGIVAVCIKIPQFLMIGFYVGNEFILKNIIFILLITIGLLFIIRSIRKKSNNHK